MSYLTVEFKCRTQEEASALWKKLTAEFDFLKDGEPEGPFISAVQSMPLTNDLPTNEQKEPSQ